MPTSIDLTPYKRYYTRHKQSLLKFYFDLLKIPSISTDPSSQTECQKAAELVESFLKDLGFNTQIHLANRNYLLFATKHVADHLPTLMFYGHTDVQPVDPLHLWDQPPFEPTVKQGAVYARGAQDNKGQLCYVLAAIKAFIETEGGLKGCNLKLVIEGEEESGSHGTEEILKKLAEQLKADELYVVDFDARSKDVPALVLGMRGLCAFEFTISNSSSDLHSGMYGGLVYNPLRAISEMIASCFNSQGYLSFEGAYDDLVKLEPIDLEAIDFSFDQSELKTKFSIGCLGVPEGVKPKEANWLMPTFELNGLTGGYTAQGVKTVLPKEACAKISCRLSKGQNPERFIASCRKHLESKLPLGFKMEFQVHQAASSFYTSIEATSVKKAKTALETAFGHQAWIGLSGASVPIVGLLAQLATPNVALLGVGLDTDNIHAPNEHFGLDRFEKGFYSIIHILKST
jgi:acetylornithine deacetylase/succinyl-diaminopimelate desuccinylase-like protein